MISICNQRYFLLFLATLFSDVSTSTCRRGAIRLRRRLDAFASVDAFASRPALRATRLRRDASRRGCARTCSTFEKKAPT
jgi:hypothetical protein